MKYDPEAVAMNGNEDAVFAWRSDSQSRVADAIGSGPSVMEGHRMSTRVTITASTLTLTRMSTLD